MPTLMHKPLSLRNGSSWPPGRPARWQARPCLLNRGLLSCGLLNCGRPAVLLVAALLVTGLLLLPAPPGARAADPEPPALTRVQVKQVVLMNDAPAVLLVDADEGHYLLMYIDFFMANAIQMGVEGPSLERPLTHDLMAIFLRHLGARVIRITIPELRDNTYYAVISIQVNGKVTEFDARPSDALALAVRSGAPVWAASALLKPMRPPPTEPGPAQPAPPARQGST